MKALYDQKYYTVIPPPIKDNEFDVKPVAGEVADAVEAPGPAADDSNKSEGSVWEKSPPGGIAPTEPFVSIEGGMKLNTKYLPMVVETPVNGPAQHDHHTFGQSYGNGTTVLSLRNSSPRNGLHTVKRLAAIGGEAHLNLERHR